MTKILKLKILFLIPVFYFLFLESAFAAETSFEVKNSDIQVGVKFEAGFFINTDNEEINAVEGKIVFPEKFLKLKEIRDGNSIINFWIERPKGSNGEILFSGIIPGGYIDKKGLIFSVVFQALQEGRGLIKTRDIKILLNDGKGTEASMRISDLEFRILKSDSQTTDSAPYLIDFKKDTDMPEVFEPIVTSDSAMFDEKYFLIFVTQDKGSGIDHYEVSESKNQKIENRKWETAESPYVLKDQKLRSFIYIKAVDKQGNERVAFISPQRSPLTLLLVILIGVIAVLRYYLIVRRNKNAFKKK